MRIPKKNTAIALLSSLMATSVVQATETEEVKLDKIVVTGELIERSKQDSTTSAAIIKGDELESRSDVDLYDIVERTPGVYSAFGEKGFSIRGIDQRGAGSASGLLISTTVDGATISNSNQLTFFGPYSAWDLEQVEVLRGPQSTQQGRNALAGAIVIKSKDPVYRQEAKIRAGLSQRGGKDVAIAVNTPVVEDKVALRVSASRNETDGHVTNPTLGTDDYDGRKLTTIRGALRFDPTENLNVVLKVTDSENFGGEDTVLAESFPEKRENLSNIDAEEGVDMTSYNLRANYKVNDRWTVESETTYFDADYTRFEDTDNSAADIGSRFRNANVENFQQELRAKYKGKKLSTVVGAFYTDVKDKAPAGGTVDAAILNPAFAPLGATISGRIDSNTKTENYAVYGELDYKVTDKLTLIAGARYDEEKFSDVSVNNITSDNAIVAGFLPPPTTEEKNTKYNAFLPKVGVAYKAKEDLNLGFVVQRGYRAGGAGTNIFNGERYEYDPEYTTNYEASVRSEMLDKRLTVNGNVFYTDWKDQQVFVVLGSNPNNTQTENAGRSSLKGAEIEVDYKPNNNLKTYASLAYVKTEFDEYKNRGEDFSGNEFANAPRFTAAAGVDYYFPNGMVTGVDLSYAGKSYVDEENSEKGVIDSRTLVNAKVGYTQDQWEVFAFARNLLNKDYATQNILGDDGEVSLLRTGEPRTIGVTAQVNFE